MTQIKIDSQTRLSFFMSSIIKIGILQERYYKQKNIKWNYIFITNLYTFFKVKFTIAKGLVKNIS